MATQSKASSSKAKTNEKVDKREARLNAFNEAISLINKDFKDVEPDGIINRLSDKPRNVEMIPSGSLVLDSILGGGIAKKRIIEIFGPEASGKTSVALTAVANVQRDGGTAAFIDMEHALDPVYAHKLGVDTDNLAVAQPSSAEDALNLMRDLIESQVVDIIILDSIGAMSPKAELEGRAEDQQMALLARLMSKTLKGLASRASKAGTTLLFINQLREKVGGFVMGNPEVTQGGKAMKFFASQRIDVRRREQIKEDGKTIGNLIKMKIVKNKVAPPYGEGHTVLTFGRGINKAAELVEVGPEYGIITKPNNRTYTNSQSGEVIGTSKAKAIEAIENDDKLFKQLSTDLSEALERKRRGEELPEAEHKPEEENDLSDELDADELESLED